MNVLLDGDPQRLGDYWLAGRLGAGGQGVVYEAYGQDGRRVAIKVLHGDQTAQLAREVSAAQRVAAFCTAPVIEAVLEGPRPYIVSEYVQGPSLRRAVAEGRRFTGGDLHRLATAVATALTAIHDAGVIHRDLKPDNVLLGPDGPRVIDFGIARTAEMSLTATGMVAGTPTYMAPEVFTGQRAEMSADVFAWGGIMLYAATGTDPFEAENLGAVMHRVLSVNPDLSVLPGSMRPLVAAALDKDPQLRPTARQLLLALISGQDAGLDTSHLLAQGDRQAAGISFEAADPALGTLAEEAYALLGANERDLAPEVFLRLVTVGERGTLSVRHAALSELMEGRPVPETSAVARILEVFGYLLGRDAEEIWLARPALPHAWPRFRRWIEANRDGLAVHREILAAARRWDRAGRRDGDLFQGHSLENALQWAATARRNITLSPTERDFLEAAAYLTRRKTRRNRLFTLSLGGLLVISLVAAGLAVQQSIVADARAEAIAAQRDKAEGERLAQVAGTLRQSDPRAALQLSVAAWRLAKSPQARAALMASVAQREVGTFKDPAAAGETVRALSRDGKTLVSVSGDAIRLWDVTTGKRAGGVAKLGLGDERLVSAALSPGGRDVLVTTAKRLIVWRPATGKVVDSWRTPPEGEVYAQYGTVDRYIMAGYDDDYGRAHDFVWDLERGTRTATGQYDGAMTAAGDAIYVRAGGAKGRVERRSLPDLTLEMSQPAAAACACRGPRALTPDGANLIEETKDDLVIGPVKGRPARDLTLQTGIKAWNGGEVTLSPDGRLFASATPTQIQVWRGFDVHLTTLYLPTGGDNGSGRVQVGFDGMTMRYIGDDRVFTVNLNDLPMRPGPVTAWSPSSLSPGALHLLGVDSDNGTVYLGDQQSRRLSPVLRPSDDIIYYTAFSPDGRLAVVATEQKITILDVATRRKLTELRPVVAGKPQITGFVQFSPDGTRLVAEHSDGRGDEHSVVSVWDWKQGRQLWSARFYSSTRGSKFSPDGRLLAVTERMSADGEGYEQRLYDAASGKKIGGHFGANGANTTIIDFVFTRDGTSMALVDGRGRITVFDVATRRQVSQISQGGKLAGQATLSPREDVVAITTTSKRVELFDLKAGVSLGLLADGDAGGLDRYTFSADGSSVLTLDYTGALHDHPVEPGKMAAAVCAKAGKPLSAAEWGRYVTGVPYRKVCP